MVQLQLQHATHQYLNSPDDVTGMNKVRVVLKMASPGKRNGR